MPSKRLRTNPSLDSLMVKVLTRLGELPIRQAYLGRDTYAMWEPDGTITINPAIDIADSLVHEILHELFPAWSERQVKTMTTRMIRHLSDAQINAIFTEYIRRVEDRE